MSAPEYEITVDRTGVTLHWQGQTFEIEADDLIDGKWEYAPMCDREHCDDGDCDPCEECETRDEADETEVRTRCEQAHYDDAHSGPWKFCDRPLCLAVGNLAGVRHG